MLGGSPFGPPLQQGFVTGLLLQVFIFFPFFLFNYLLGLWVVASSAGKIFCGGIIGLGFERFSCGWRRDLVVFGVRKH